MSTRAADAGKCGLVALGSLALLLAGVVFQSAHAQTRYSYLSGQSVSPAFEGWWPNQDGSHTLFFGYMNSNWEQEFDVPIGPDNNIQPGGPDQGQPTHFYPRRNPFLFTVNVPKDFGTKELVWTLTANGKTEKVYASLKPDYTIDKQVISTEIGGDMGSLRDELRTNVPPELAIAGDKERSVKVGQPLELVAMAKDPDNIPARRGGGAGRGRAGAAGNEAGAGSRAGSAAGAQPPAAAGRGQAPAGAAGGRGQAAANQSGLPPLPSPSLAARSGPGLRLSWIVYRGKAAVVTFNPDQMKTWMDTRPYANSPWSPPYTIPQPPPDGKWVVQATFAESGQYTLLAVASDGSLFTYDRVTVNVAR